MRIAIYGDVHWCQYSSIVRKSGKKYSLRLENLIKSVNWAEETAKENQCNIIVNLGDFFDKSELNSEEITALNDVVWDDVMRFNIVGNHEMGRSDLSRSSSHLFKMLPESVVVDEPMVYDFGNVELAFLPYVLEEGRKDIKSYLPRTVIKDRILFMHNDIQGIQMGRFKSTQGFSKEDIEDSCDICFNGHLHNGVKLSSKLINVGNLTGQNFSEDAFIYTHGMYVYDTDKDKLLFFENPFALNFYKFDYRSELLSPLKKNAVCVIQCNEDDIQDVKNYIADDIIESRIIVKQEEVEVEHDSVELFSEDHVKRFHDYILNNMENTEILLQELQEVCK